MLSLCKLYPDPTSMAIYLVPQQSCDSRSSCLRAAVRMFNRSGMVVRFSWRTHEHAAQERGLADAGRPHNPRARQFCDDVFAVDPLEGCIWPEARMSQHVHEK